MRATPELVLLHVDQQVYRIGYAPAPWAWSGWEFADRVGAAMEKVIRHGEELLAWHPQPTVEVAAE